jgi:drug/metabolite transporter (DMT)-like permease
MACFFMGLASTPLVEVNALEFAYPIFATILAIFVYREVPRARRIIALLIGFAGAMIALRPGFAEVGQGQLFILLASFLWGGVTLCIRELGKTETAVTQSLYLGFVLVPVAAAFAVPVWVWPNLVQLGLIVVIGTTATIGQLLYAEAFRRAEMGAVLPLDFSKLGFSAIIGFAVFTEVPDALTVVGAAITFGAGAYITIREAQLARQGR